MILDPEVRLLGYDLDDVLVGYGGDALAVSPGQLLGNEIVLFVLPLRVRAVLVLLYLVKVHHARDVVEDDVALVRH